MPPLPLREKVYRNSEQTHNELFLERLQDCVRKELMIPLQRPGLSLKYNTNTGKQIDGIFEWSVKNIGVAVSDGKVFKLQKNLPPVEITGATLIAGTPVSFAVFSKSFMLMANGGRIIKWNGGATCEYIASASAPTTVTHVQVFNQYVLALVADTADMYFSDVGDPDTWLGEFVSAERKPDDVASIVAEWGEIAFIGEETIEYRYNSENAAEPFATIPVTTNGGTFAPYSVQVVDNGLFFLDNERNVVRVVERSLKVLSNAIAKDLQALETVSDAIGMNIQCDGLRLYVITFPTEDKTFVYDYKQNDWYDWGFYDSTNALYQRWLGNCSVYMKKWNQHLVGSRRDGKIYEISTDYHDDDGSFIRNYVETGWINHGTNAWKGCAVLDLYLERGSGIASEVEPDIFINFRDNNNIEWSNDRNIGLGKIGQRDVNKKIRQLGRYQRRKWRFVMTDDVPFALLGAEETVSGLEQDLG